MLKIEERIMTHVHSPDDKCCFLACISSFLDDKGIKNESIHK